jgi:hypothetical protein
MPLNVGPSPAFGRSGPVPIQRPTNPGMNRGYSMTPPPQMGRPGMGNGGMPPGQMPGRMPAFGRVPMAGAPPMGHPAPPPMVGGGMVRPPSMMQPPPPMAPGGGGVMPQPGFNIHSPMMGGNTGVTGGMMGRPMPAPNMPPQGGGLWNAYNNLANQQSGPPRPPMGY